MSEYQEDPEETAAAELLAQDHDPRCPLLTVDTDILFAGRNYGIIDELCTCRDEDGHHRRPREDELDVDGEDR